MKNQYVNDALDDISKAKYRNQPCWCGSGKKIKKCDCLDNKKKVREEQQKEYVEALDLKRTNRKIKKQML